MEQLDFRESLQHEPIYLALEIALYQVRSRIVFIRQASNIVVTYRPDDRLKQLSEHVKRILVPTDDETIDREFIVTIRNITRMLDMASNGQEHSITSRAFGATLLRSITPMKDAIALLHDVIEAMILVVDTETTSKDVLMLAINNVSLLRQELHYIDDVLVPRIIYEIDKDV